jgi:hypothetical protein
MIRLSPRAGLLLLASMGTALAQLPAVGASWQLNPGQANFSGTWKLNTERSRWSNTRKPTGVFVTIEHNQAGLKYSGSVVSEGGEQRDFAFRGTIDGKEYPATREYGQGKIVLKWAGSNAFTSSFKSDDGKFVETTTTSLSRNAKILTQQGRLQTPDGVKTWSETYEKQ